MKEQLEAITKRLREISNELGKIERPFNSDTEDNLDGATGAIQDAIEELEEIISRN